jgi:hypothetical protein
MTTGIAAIDDLVAAYNVAEIEQAERLRAIFSLVKNREGYRHVRFAGGLWNNCWDNPDRLDEPFIAAMARPIVEVMPGAERPEPRPADEVPYVKGQRAETV